jgi:predicted GIY-YIG superfamily endonuclease
MPFWTYMLHCHGGYFYVGHTDDIDRRIGEHKSGLISGFTANHQPVELVWSDQFRTRDEAKAAERKLKGWSRAKKLALIRGDWDRISELAKKKDSASTSSAWTALGEMPLSKSNSTSNPVYPEPVEGSSFALWAHPAEGALRVKSLLCVLKRLRTDLIELTYTVEARAGVLVLPMGSGARRDGLWKSTCFELFIGRTGVTTYREFNFSPGGDWAAYEFSAYRSEQQNLTLHEAPLIEVLQESEGLTVNVRLSIDGLAEGDPIGISAVIDELNFRSSFWSICHTRTEPDFHHPTCFAATLPAPEHP